MAEEYDASVCLFWYQTGEYTADNWRRSQCTCEDREKLRESLKRFDNAWTRSQKSQDQPEFSLSREAIEKLNPGDTPFYLAAWREFERRVTLVEQRVGHRFLHCDAAAGKSDASVGGGSRFGWLV